MAKRHLMWLGVCTLLITALVGLWTLYGTHSVSFTEAEIQKQIDPQLDTTTLLSGDMRAVNSITLKSVRVRFEENQVWVEASAEGTTRFNKKFSLTAETNGTPRYTGGTFYFTPNQIKIHNFEYEGSTPSEVIRSFAERRISNERTRQFIEEKAPMAEDWITRTTQNTLIRVLENRPVYHLKNDAKGMILRTSLESVRVEQDRLIISFSLWQLTLNVIIGIIALILAIGMAIALMRNPTLGLPLILLE